MWLCCVRGKSFQVMIIDHASYVCSYRFNDIDVKVRLKCVQLTVEVVKQNPDVKNDITEAFKHRIHDTDENVRFEVVRSIVTIANHHPFSLSENEDLLELIKDRVKDKKVKVMQPRTFRNARARILLELAD